MRTLGGSLELLLSLAGEKWHSATLIIANGKKKHLLETNQVTKKNAKAEKAALAEEFARQ